MALDNSLKRPWPGLHGDSTGSSDSRLGYRFLDDPRPPAKKPMQVVNLLGDSSCSSRRDSLQPGHDGMITPISNTSGGLPATREMSLLESIRARLTGQTPAPAVAPAIEAIERRSPAKTIKESSFMRYLSSTKSLTSALDGLESSRRVSNASKSLLSYSKKPLQRPFLSMNKPEPVMRSFMSQNIPRYQQLHEQKLKLVAQAKKWAVEVKGGDSAFDPEPPLEKHKVDLINETWRGPSRILGNAYRVDLSSSDLQTLRPGKWLNDNVIDMYLTGATQKLPPGRTAFAFTTHFYTKLSEDGYKSVSKWALRKKVDVRKLDVVIVPVNRNNVHWTLAVINNKDKTFEFYDSLNGDGSDVLPHLQEYMVKESDRLQSGNHDAHVQLYASYKHVPRAKSPQQKNGSDCGVFMSQNAVSLSRGITPAFRQDDMPNFRLRMAYELLEHVGVAKAKL